MSKASELRDVAVDELDLKLDTLRREIYELRSEKLDGKSQQTHLISQKRKEIARIMTVKRGKA